MTCYEKGTLTVSMGCPTRTLATPPAEPDTKSTKASLTIAMLGEKIDAKQESTRAQHKMNKSTEQLLNQHQQEISKWTGQVPISMAGTEQSASGIELVQL